MSEAIYPIRSAVWLKTGDPVLSMNSAIAGHISEVESVLRQGVSAMTDANHEGFYEVEVDSNWYYLHISNHTHGVYLVAAGKNAPFKAAPPTAAQPCA